MTDKTQIFIGDEEIGVKEFTFTQSTDWVGPEVFVDSAPSYVRGLKDRTLTFETANARLEDLPMSGDGARDITLSHTYHWPRWRRWLNATLRVAWWPLGPARLPTSFGLNISEMYVTMSELSHDGRMRVEMSSRKPGS